MPKRRDSRAWRVALPVVMVIAGCSDSSTATRADAAADAGFDLRSDIAVVDLVPDSSPDVVAADALPPATAQRESAFIWQGFDHAWLRKVAGFLIPHRVSRFDSYLDSEQHQGATAASWQATASFHVAQGTGVDGNYMKPRGYYRALRAPGLFVARESVKIAFTDQVVGDPPQARTTQKQVVEIDLDRPGLGFGGLDAYTAVLRGLALTTRCDDAKQPASEPCNSDGLWPFRFAVSLEACVPAPQPKRLQCPLTVELYRAWTPNKGGLPGIAEKPLNARLDVELTVYLSVLGADQKDARFTRGALTQGAGKGHDSSPFATQALVQGAGGQVYPRAVVGLTSFGFTLSADNPGDLSQQQLGRYIGALRFSARGASYDPASGAASVDLEAQVWMPITVVQTKVAYELRPELIQLAASDAVVAAPGSVEGAICQNSSPQAPIFSIWKKCGEPDKGPERVSDVAAISAP